MRQIVAIRCDWCETELDGDEALDDAVNSWLHLTIGEEEYDFCDSDCLIAFL